jgi:hypothetical protein
MEQLPEALLGEIMHALLPPSPCLKDACQLLVVSKGIRAALMQVAADHRTACMRVPQSMPCTSTLHAYLTSPLPRTGSGPSLQPEI